MWWTTGSWGSWFSLKWTSWKFGSEQKYSPSAGQMEPTGVWTETFMSWVIPRPPERRSSKHGKEQREYSESTKSSTATTDGSTARWNFSFEYKIFKLRIWTTSRRGDASSIFIYSLYVYSRSVCSRERARAERRASAAHSSTTKQRHMNSRRYPGTQEPDRYMSRMGCICVFFLLIYSYLW